MCTFCDIVKHTLDANIVYEDNLIIAFLDSNPINEGHILIVPKEHYLDIDEIPEDITSHIMFVAKKIVTALKLYIILMVTQLCRMVVFLTISVIFICIFSQDIQMMALIGLIMKKKLNTQKRLLKK